MNCDQRKGQVNLFIDGDLGSGENSALFAHLGECPDCTDFFEVLLKVKESGRGERVVYPADLDDAILGVVTARQPRWRKQGVTGTPWKFLWGRRVALPVPLAVAAVVLIALLVLLVFRSARRESISEQIPRRTPIAAHEYPGQRTPVNFVYGMPEVRVYGNHSAKKN